MSDEAAPAKTQDQGGVSAIFWALIGAFALCVMWLTRGNLAGPATFAFVFVGWIISLCLHEWGHAFVAWKGGDASIAGKGYLTLNPLRYTDAAYSIVLPLVFLAIGGIGFPGGAVYVQTSALRTRLWGSAVSAAGPMMNLLCLLVIGLGFRAGAFGEDTPLAAAFAFLAFLQATALILNLLPIPGFDGFGILEGLLPPGVVRALAPVRAIATLAFFAMIFLAPGFLQPLWSAARALCEGMGIEIGSIAAGYGQFQFWNSMDAVR